MPVARVRLTIEGMAFPHPRGHVPMACRQEGGGVMNLSVRAWCGVCVFVWEGYAYG